MNRVKIIKSTFAIGTMSLLITTSAMPVHAASLVGTVTKPVEQVSSVVTNIIAPVLSTQAAPSQSSTPASTNSSQASRPQTSTTPTTRPQTTSNPVDQVTTTVLAPITPVISDAPNDAATSVTQPTRTVSQAQVAPTSDVTEADATEVYEPAVQAVQDTSALSAQTASDQAMNSLGANTYRSNMINPALAKTLYQVSAVAAIGGFILYVLSVLRVSSLRTPMKLLRIRTTN